jgi:hypothetical protein
MEHGMKEAILIAASAVFLTSAVPVRAQAPSEMI